MDFIQQHLFDQGWLSLRDVLRLLLLSGLFTVACMLAFPRNAPTRRILLLAAVTILTILPWLLASVDVIWPVVFDSLPPITLGALVPNVVLWIWLFFSVLLVSQHLLDVWQEIRLLQRLPLINNVELTSHVAELAQRLDFEPPQLRLGANACSTTLGTALIVLPREWQRWDGSTLRSVLLHELTHIQRRDDRWLLLTRILVLAYWWMPWLIVLYRVYLRAMEESCDDAASEALGHQHAYVGALLDVARVKHDGYLNVANMHQHHLVGRVGRFASTRMVELDTQGVYWCVLGILVCVIALTGFEPVVRTQFAQATPGTGFRYQLQTKLETAAYPIVHQSTEIPAGISGVYRDRLDTPEYEPPVIYPGAAIRKNVEGDVLVGYIVNADGTVSQVKVLRSTQPLLFDASVLRAVQNTRYAPAYSTRSVARSALRTPNQPPARIKRFFRFRIREQ